MKKITNKLEYQSESTIWKVCFDHSKPIVVFENRDENTRKASLTAIDFDENKIILNNWTLPKKWWMSLLASYNGIVLLQEQSSTQQTETIATSGIEIISQKKKWEVENFSLSEIVQDTVILQRFNEKQEATFKYIKIDSGETATPETLQENLSLKNKNLLFAPHVYNLTNEYFKVFKEFLNDFLQIDAQESIEYLEFEDKILISYYIYQDNLINNYLLVIDSSKNILLHEQLSSSKGIGLNTFVIFSGKLFFIRNKNQILIYEF
ncbi:MAG: DUF4905 domain-containing protein [Pseudarcicella sp.]|nr:DUF4905 domain-containing protein [Pseudarcicella sp.]MBP6409906.1 DUF4905 domain-containing protein [Pseudarcicella sp.]